MRIAAVNSVHARIGGVETYLDTVISGLAGAGHQIAFLSELGAPQGARHIRLPDGAPLWCATEMGVAQALAALRAWRPDVIYIHGMSFVHIAASVTEIAPTVLFDHGYYGTCISGNKMFAWPHPRPCARRLGWRCLVHYYPHRCGGLNPLSMLLDYRMQSSRLRVMRRYTAILTASAHMRAELVRHGLPPDRLHVLRLPIISDQHPERPTVRRGVSTENRELRLLFVGRMTPLKGGPTLLDALALAVESLGTPAKMTFVGDGPDRAQWERKALQVQLVNTNLTIEFTGWMYRTSLARLMDNSDLLVLPSTWPEPFGLVGLEAGLHGLPAAAFAVGGVSEWLSDGVNGHLAPGDPPNAAGLAQAIVKCVGDPIEYARLRRGALEIASSFGLDKHLRDLNAILVKATEMEVKDRRNSPHGFHH